jgi:hypothetical protein
VWIWAWVIAVCMAALPMLRMVSLRATGVSWSDGGGG